MTDDEKAAAVHEGLAGFVRCEGCGLKMSLVAVWLGGGRRSPRLCYDCWAIAFCTEVYGGGDDTAAALAALVNAGIMKKP